MQTRFVRLSAAGFAVFGAAALAIAQSPWKSGSTGLDGALDYSQQPPGTYTFSPATLPAPLAANHGSVYNFSSITIPAGITVKLSGQVLSGPQYWLSTGDVNIAGIVDLSGTAGYAATNLISNRTPSIPGPGGFPGGVGGGAVGSPDPVENGQGPGAGITACLGAGDGPPYAGGGQFTGNQFLVPLIGGSGGAGSSAGGTFGFGGGAGGGALLIASDTTINVNGTITAVGGDPGIVGPGYGGAGSGGAIRLAATTIAGTGTLTSASGNNSGDAADCRAATNGAVRLEAFNQQFAGTVSGTPYSGTPYLTFVPNGTEPILTVVSVNNISVAPNPTGSFTTPDVTFTSSQPVSVLINGMNIPAGTPVSLQVYSENGNDIVMPNAGTLSGTSDPTSATISVNFPPGFSRGFISATFTSPSQSPQAKKSVVVKPPGKLNAPK